MPSLSFYKGFDEQQDRLAKKRKDNREAFDAYRKMKAELGEDVTAAELQQYRESLAGGDAFFLRDLGPGEMLKDIAERTNDRAENTRILEEQKNLKAKEEERTFWNNFVSSNLNLDPTDMGAAKAKWMSGFANRPEVGEKLWGQFSANLSENLLNNRSDAIQSYLSDRITAMNIEDPEEVKKIMAADGLPAWKRDGVLRSAEAMFRAKNDERMSKAVETARTTTTDLRLMDENSIEQEAQAILDGQLAYGRTNINQETYTAAKNMVIRTLKQVQKRQLGLKLEENTAAFNAELKKPNTILSMTIAAKGMDSEDTFEIYNKMREDHGLERLESMKDPRYKNDLQVIETYEATVYQAEYEKEITRLTTQAEGKFKSLKTNWDYLKRMGVGVQGSVLNTALALIESDGQMHPQFADINQNAQLTAQILAEFEQQLAMGGSNVTIEDLTSKDVAELSAEDRQEYLGLISALKNKIEGSRLVMSQAELKQQELNNIDMIEPGAEFGTYSTDLSQRSTGSIDSYIDKINNLPINTPPAKVAEFREKGEQVIREMIDEERRVINKNRIAFGGETLEFSQQVETHLMDLERQLLEKLRQAELKPSQIPMNWFERSNNTNPQRPLFIPSDEGLSTPGIVDSEGRPLQAGAQYEIVDGQIVLAVPAGGAVSPTGQVVSPTSTGARFSGNLSGNAATGSYSGVSPFEEWRTGVNNDLNLYGRLGRINEKVRSGGYGNPGNRNYQKLYNFFAGTNDPQYYADRAVTDYMNDSIGFRGWDVNQQLIEAFTQNPALLNEFEQNPFVFMEKYPEFFPDR